MASVLRLPGRGARRRLPAHKGVESEDQGQLTRTVPRFRFRRGFKSRRATRSIAKFHELTSVGHDIAIYIRCLPMHLDSMAGNFIKLCPPRLREVLHPSRTSQSPRWRTLKI